MTSRPQSVVIVALILTAFSLSVLTLSAPSSASGHCSGCISPCTTVGEFCSAVADTSTSAPWSGNEVTGASAYGYSWIIGSTLGPTPTGTVMYYLYTDNDCGGTSSPSAPSSTDEITSLNQNNWPYSVTLDSEGNVPPSQDTGPLAAGTYSFLALYSGDTNYGPKYSCASFIVLPISTAVYDASTSAPWSGSEATSASAYDTSAVIEPGTTPTPTGTVTYYYYADGACGSADEVTSLNGNTWPQTVNLNPDGSVPSSKATGPLVAGQYSFQAVYSGDGDYEGATSSCEPFSVLGINTVVFDSSTNAAWSGTEVAGASAYDTSSVTGGKYTIFTGHYILPTGTVTYSFYEDGTCGAADEVWTDTVTLSGGVVPSSQATGPLVAGQYSFQAVYSGDSQYNGVTYTSVCEPFTVLPASPTVTSSPSPTSLTLSTTAPTLTDTATLSGGYSETGSITFTLYYNGGSTPVDTETVSVSGNGVYATPAGYTLPTSGTVTGTYQWDASYSGDSNNVAVSDNGATNEQVAVSPASTSTTLACTTPVIVGSPSTCQATVSGNYGSLNGETISFSALPASSGTFSSMTCPLSGGSCSVTFTPSPGKEGTISITATYGGDGNNLGSHAISSVVAQSDTTTVVACLPFTGTVGVSETCGVAVVNNDLKYNVQATGTVTFVGTLPNGMPSSCTLPGGSGIIAICTITWTPPSGSEGTYTISATYGGDTTHATSSSNHWTLQISKRSVHVSLSCSGPFQHGEPITCTVAVTDSSLGTPLTPTGTVSFTNKGSGTFTSSSCTLSTVSLGKATCQVTFTPSSSGAYTLIASYSGDTDHFGGFGLATFKVT